ncbi:MAG: FliM/FliN family flagellar motor switch protein [Bacteroidales bacterium]|nr:FliM/FliN family flagellar motor switch protein [Candidatus Latescibacterota bacterium]
MATEKTTETPDNIDTTGEEIVEDIAGQDAARDNDLAGDVDGPDVASTGAEDMETGSESENSPETGQLAGQNLSDSDGTGEDMVDESISSVIDELEKGGVAPEQVLEEFTAAAVPQNVQQPTGVDNISMLMDVDMTVRVELGRSKRSVEEIMNLNPGMVMELDRKAGDTVDLYLNEKLFAEGEVTVVDGNFAIRITRLISRL